MTAPFDPYHRWLGLLPKDQPADHYRLLGLSRHEDDVEVIRDAAERQIAHVRRYAAAHTPVRADPAGTELLITNSIEMQLALISADEFLMGSSQT